MTEESTTYQQYEDPEGLDEQIDLGEYPIDSVLIRNENRSVFEVVRRMKNGQYILDPDFQRDFVWKSKQQSKLIESALMRIPLPVFYLAEQMDGRVVVVDGLQRLTTFYRFLNNEFALTGLSGKSEDLNDKYFDDLIPKLQNRLEDTNLTLYLIDSKVPERARLDIFDRVNSGVPLSRQQMRNCLYLGSATRWLKTQAKNDWFQKATAGSLNPDTMRDREAINRFCGFSIFGVDTYRGDMDEFLAETLKHMNGMTSEELEKLATSFETSMRNNFIVFDRFAFRKHTSTDDHLSVINIAIFDVMSVQMANYTTEFVTQNNDIIHQLFYKLMNDENFYNAITLSTNNTKKVRARYEMVQTFFQEIDAC